VSFKPNPKAQAENKFYELFGSRLDVELSGRRLTDAECKRDKCPRGTYLAELKVAGVLFAEGRSSDWRKAYKLVKLVVEQRWSEDAARQKPVAASSG
jgi:hypothetical protein